MSAVLGAVDALLAANPELGGRRLSRCDWILTIPGRVRTEVTVALHVEATTARLTSFLLRGPRSAEAAASLHRRLLRRNHTLRRIRLALDEDGDVVLIASLSAAALPGELDAILAEMLSVSESSFEAFVHLAYPGVFAPLERAWDGGEAQSRRF